jgi:hypothetical protein
MSFLSERHFPNTSDSGSRDQEDGGFEVSLGKKFKRPYLEKNPSQKKASEVAQDVGPEFKPQNHPPKKEQSHLF